MSRCFPKTSYIKSGFILVVLFTCFLTIRIVTLVTLQLQPDGSGSCVLKKQNVSRLPDVAPIPFRIHQLFFDVGKPMPDRFRKAALTWSLHNPHFQYTLWNTSMVDNLIDVHFPEIRPLYDSYGHWVQRVDVARLLILSQYGGVFIDMDIKCKHGGITTLLTSIPKEKDFCVYKTKPIGVASDFLIARPKSRFLRSLICGLWESNRNYFIPYLTVMMSTGPLYIGARLSSYENKDEVYLMEDSKISPYIIHINGATWHQLDGKVIWWVFVNLKFIGKVSAVIVITLALLVCSCRLYPYAKRRLADCRLLKRTTTKMNI